MRRTTFGLLSTAAVAAAALVLGPHGVAAEPPATDVAGWRFDVRVVRVCAPEATVEQAPALPGQQPDGTMTGTWAEALAALKARGATQIVMDRSTTGQTGIPISVQQMQSEHVMATIRYDKDNVSVEARPLSTGATAQLVVSAAAEGGPAHLAYSIDVDWARASAQRIAPITHRAAWKGNHVLGQDATLVLRHAEQDGAGGGTEIYVLVSFRRLAR